MNPDHLVGMAAFALVSGGIRLVKAPTEEEIERREQERLAAIAAKRAASPHVAAAIAKRERKAAAIRNRTGE